MRSTLFYFVQAVVIVVCLSSVRGDLLGAIAGAVSNGVTAAEGAASSASSAASSAASTATAGSAVTNVTSAAAGAASTAGNAAPSAAASAATAISSAAAGLALTPAVTAAANTAASNLQGNLNNLTSNSTAIYTQGLTGATNRITAAEITFASAAGSSLASEGQAVINVTQVGSIVGAQAASAVDSIVRNGTRHPIVFWPGYGLSLLQVNVSKNTQAGCPENGTFKVGYGYSSEDDGYPERCIYPLLKLQHNSELNFSNQAGISTSVINFGSPSCSPVLYAPMYTFLQGVGYQPGKDFFVACYDWRMSPTTDVGIDGPQLQNYRQLVETAYNNTNGTKVYLLGHSNGPVYSLALLSKQSAEWRQKYIAGFVPIAGNWIGRGYVYSALLSGQSLFDSAPYGISAPAVATWPSTYLSASFPDQYNETETVIVHQGNGNYTPANVADYYKNADIAYAADLGPLIQGNLTPAATSPGTHFYGFYGLGLPTPVGATYSNFTVGAASINDSDIHLDGDGTLEGMCSHSALEWNSTLSPCYHFELNQVQGINHLQLPSNPSVLQAVTAIVHSAPPALSCGTVSRP